MVDRRYHPDRDLECSGFRFRRRQHCNLHGDSLGCPAGWNRHLPEPGHIQQRRRPVAVVNVIIWVQIDRERKVLRGQGKVARTVRLVALLLRFLRLCFCCGLLV